MDNTPLIVIDVQNGFVNSRSEHVLPNIVKLCNDWTSLERGPIFFTRFFNSEGSNWESLIDWHRLQGSPDVDLHKAVATIASDHMVVDKQTYSSLTSEVLDYLTSSSPEAVYVCGIATDGCVLKTAVDLFELPLLVRPVVVKDCCASHAGDEIHQMGLRLIERFVGRKQVIDSAAALS